MTSGETGLADFRRLWAAQALSAVGSRITRTALPILAVATLGASEATVGVLMALTFAPGVLVALVVGGAVDRGRKRRLLIGADLVRAALVASVAVAWFVDTLTVAHLIVVGAGVGAATALFQITDNALVPRLVPSGRLVWANRRLEATEAVAEISGPAIGGVLVRAIGAPLAMAVDALTYLWSAAWLSRLRVDETPGPPVPRQLRADLRVGVRALFDDPIVARLVVAQVAASLSGGFFMTLYTLFVLRTVGFDEATLGTVIGAGGIGALGGAALAPWVARRRFGRGLWSCAAGSAACALLIPLAPGPGILGLALLLAHQLVGDGLMVAYQVHAVSLRQTRIAADRLGRANAALHVCTAGLVPVAALGAGLLAEICGTRAAVWVGVSIGLVAPVVLWPLRQLAAPRDT